MPGQVGIMMNIMNENNPKTFAIPILTASDLILAVAIAIRRGIANALEFILIL